MKKITVLIICVLAIIIYSYLIFKSRPKSDYTQYIQNKDITAGMTKEQVIASWGSPDSINRTTEKNSTKETWVYYKSRQKPTYLKFQEGVLKSYNN